MTLLDQLLARAVECDRTDHCADCGRLFAVAETVVLEFRPDENGSLLRGKGVLLCKACAEKNRE